MRYVQPLTTRPQKATMVLLVEKLGRSLNFPSGKSHASLAAFRSRISESVAAILHKPDPDSSSPLLSLAGFNRCFELIHTTNAAFAKLAVEVDCPMRQWGATVTDHYLSFTSHLLGLINAVTSSLSHLNQAKMRLLHALTNSSSAAAAHHRLNRLPVEKLKLVRPIAMGDGGHCSRAESVLIEALTLSRKLGLLALGFVVAGLSSDAKPYLQIREILGGVDGDSVLKDVDSRFCKELMGLQGIAVEEMKAVNDCASVEELKRRLKGMEKLMQGIDEKANNLFSQVLNARTKLLANIRVPE